MVASLIASTANARSRRVPTATTAAGPAAFACPACCGPLAGLACRSCGVTYPRLGGDVPVLIRQPRRHLAAEALRLHREIESLAGRAALCRSESERQPGRRAPLRRLAEALAHNGRVLEELLGLALAELGPRDVLEAAASSARSSAYGGARLFSLLRRDRAGEPEGEAELAALLAGLRPELEPVGGGPALVLGAGVGRLAEAVGGQGWTTIALESALAMAAAVVRLRRGPLRAHDVLTRNARLTEDGARPFEARAGRGDDVAYVLGDALRAPLPAASVSLVVSVYFTDVVPVFDLIAEVWRLLRPGGRFVHVGPLGYHHDDLTQHLSARELLDAFADAGFTVDGPRWAPSPHLDAAGSLQRCGFDNLVFRAEKPRAGGPLVGCRPAEGPPRAPLLPLGWRSR